MEPSLFAGRNLIYEYRSADNRLDRLPAIAAELVRRPVTVLGVGALAPIFAAKAATQTIPIVFVTGANPVERGIVASLARPGGNITGVTNINNELISKRLEMLHELVPSAAVVAFLVNPTSPLTEVEMMLSQATATALGLRLQIVKSASEDQFEEVASLSKAITGVCIARLIDEGHLSFSSPLGVVLSGSFQKFKQPVDARFPSVTIEQLLMHRGGLVRELPPGDTEPRELDDMFRKVLAIPLEADPGAKMSYSNIGYRIRGKIVEVISKKSYEPYCRENVLTPMSASGSIERRGIGPSGGWRISPVDYAKFMEVFDPKSSLLGKESRAWLDTRHEVPTYGLGMFFDAPVIASSIFTTGKMCAEAEPIRSSSATVGPPSLLSPVTTMMTFTGTCVAVWSPQSPSRHSPEAVICRKCRQGVPVRATLSWTPFVAPPLMSIAFSVAQAVRSSRSACDYVRTHHQPQDFQGARPQPPGNAVGDGR
jgi:Beta-lactamase/ABC transporter substrate binding protein